MKYKIFDDHKAENFYPLTLNRSCSELRVGILKLRQRIAAYLEIEKYGLIVSCFLQELYRERHPYKGVNVADEGETVFVNSRLKINDEWAAKIKRMPLNSMFSDGEVVFAARLNIESKAELSSENLPELFKGLKPIKVTEQNCWEYIWELITANEAYIQQDFSDFFYDADNHYQVEPGVTILNPYNVWIGEGAVLQPGVVIDASEGAVVLDEGCKIMANSVIVGPAYIGKKSVIKVGAKIYEGTTIGPVCKVGGEVEATIFQGYGNKQHDGFLGHSYLGEWINLGANTNNSDLKNNYKPVSVYFHPHKQKKDTGCLFVGTIMGDHSKTAISTVINTGTVIGVGCNLIGNELIKDHVQSFSWGSSNSYTEHRLEAFFETADKVKKRRKLILSETEKDVYKGIAVNIQ